MVSLSHSPRGILRVLLAASWLATAVLGQDRTLYTGWTMKFDNTPYPTQTAFVGDKLTFIWTIDNLQNVFIHPTNDCTQTGRIAIGNQSPTEYVFQPEDAGKSLFFACDIDDRCEEYGMQLIVNVISLDNNNDEDNTPAVSLTQEPTAAPEFFKFRTQSPTFAPIAPSEPARTPEPTIAATDFPTWPPPVVPTDVPTVSPTPDPTGFPTARPTASPTDSPTVSPTLTPTTPPNPLPTFPPTERPTTLEPTIAPATPGPTVSPTVVDNGSDGTTRVAMRGLQMTLTGADAFSDETQSAWRGETEAFVTSHYESDHRGISFATSIAVTNHEALSSSRFRQLVRGRGDGTPNTRGGPNDRRLQESSVVVTYDQVVSYRDASGKAFSEAYLATSAFAFSEQRANYVEGLRATGDPVLEAVTDSSPVTIGSKTTPTEAPVSTPVPRPSPTPKSGGLSTTAIIGIACGAAAVLVLAALVAIYSRGGSGDPEPDEDGDSPPKKISIKEDEVSTLAGPTITNPNTGAGERSIGTVDYDYSKAYGNGEHSLSSAGGTFGSNTQNISFPMNADATGAALGPYGEDGTYENQFRPGAKVKEEILTIFAPPGKLGVVIDTPDDGAPLVHAVKDTSVVVDKVKVGDKLVAVDDEDVRTLSAIKVSKLISRKSANPSRKLTILRTTQIG